jgi:subtilisin family serine protease
MNLRKKLMALILVLVSFIVFSQSNLNGRLKQGLFTNEFANKIFTILAEGNVEQLKTHQSVYNYRVVYSAKNIACLEVTTTALSKLMEQNYIQYAEFIEANKQPMNDTMVVRNRIKPVKQGQAPLLQAYDGTNVVVGIIDTGTDFNHPDFKDNMGSSRIQFIWDQVPTVGSTVPQPFNYGIEWTKAQINASVCTHNDNPYYGHGTHVSGIVAGNGLANGKHEGCAPKADIIVVAIDFNKNAPVIPDAIQYLITKANALGKPLVINASLGGYYGSHDGTDLEAKLIDAMIANQPGKVLVAAAGNGGHVKFHAQTNLTNSDTLFTWLDNNTKAKDYWTYADTNAIKQVQITVGANRSNFSNLGTIGFKPWNYGLTSVKVDTLKFSNKLIGVVYTSASINTSGVYELYISIDADSASYKWRIESKGTGKHDAWNFDFVSSGLPTVAQYPKITKYVMPDTLQTIVSSFQCSDQVIVVANYENLNTYVDVNNVTQSTGAVVGKISASSSIGPTRDGRVKPDVAATGNGVFSSYPLSLLPLVIANQPAAVAFGGKHYYGGGTSASSPVVAGLAALYLQKNPTATNIQVKNAIINCTYTDAFTGVVPNTQFGYGKLDGKAAILCNVLMTSVNEQSLNTAVRVFPNPANQFFTIELPSNENYRLSILDISGRIIHETKQVGNGEKINTNLFPAKGLYLLRFQNEAQQVVVKKIIVSE